MIQTFVEREFQPSFAEGKEPKLLSASNIHSDYAHHTRSLHKHEDRCELLFVRYGGSDYVVGEQTYRVRKGDMIITNSGVLHDEWLGKDDTVAYYSLAIGDLELPDLPLNHLMSDDMQPVIPTGEHYEFFNFMLSSIYELMVSKEQGVEETCHHLMVAVLSLLLHLMQSDDFKKESVVSSSLIMDVRAYLDEHYMEDISLQTISQKFFVSSYHLSHVFKDETGYSPMNYVYRRRIGEAQTLLITTKDTITDIAVRVGFSNPNNFNIQFQKQVGLSPRQYRKIYLTHVPGEPGSEGEEE